MKYYGLFRAMGDKKVKTAERVFTVDDANYHDALYRFAPIQDWLRNQDGRAWKLEEIQDTEFRLHQAENAPALDESYNNLYYVAKHDYEQMIIEGTRLLGLKEDGRTNGYGSYLRVKDTGETCFACPNGKFFEHEETDRLVEKVAASYLPPHRPTDSFPWHPVLFPYVRQDGELRVDVTHFIRSNFILAFPIQLWGGESYEQQVAWIMEREGM